MKLLSLVFAIILSINLYSQGVKDNLVYTGYQDKTIIVRNQVLNDIVTQYFIEAGLAGLDLSRYNGLVELKFSTDEEMSALCLCEPWGLTKYSEGRAISNIFINYQTLLYDLDYPIEFVKLIVYHELWHVFAPDIRHSDLPGVPRVFNTGIDPECDFRLKKNEIEIYFKNLISMADFKPPTYPRFPTYIPRL